MAEPFKNLIDVSLVRRAGKHLGRLYRGFDRARFESLALDGLDRLELKARALQICDALEATLPADFGAAATLIEAALAAPGSLDGGSWSGSEDEGLAGWIVWPLGEFVARRGLDAPERALRTLHALTQRFTAEWAIRPFIVAHPDLAFATLQRWTRDPSAHVRRLVSEGSRPRLPWGLQLKGLVADPSPTLPLLRALQDDPSDYVRRSVANHLNDIAKDHPAVVVQWVQTHLADATPQRRALLRHASRTLVKRGDKPMLRAWGLGEAFRGKASLSVSPSRVSLGDSVTIELALVSTARRAQKLAIDYAVHHLQADGQRRPKVFKGWVIELAANEARVLVKRHSMRTVTTRRYRAGPHELDVRVNGVEVARAGFELST